MFLLPGDLLGTGSAPAAEPTALMATTPHLPAGRAAASQELFFEKQTQRT